MKTHIFWWMAMAAFCVIISRVNAQTIPRPDVCPACVLDTTGGYWSIEDTIKLNPICNYELLTAAHLAANGQSRDTITFYPGNINKLYKKSGYSRGHVIPFEDLGYSPATAKASMNLRRNLAPEPQGQNIGTELHSENQERLLAIQYLTVKVYAGTYGSAGTMKGVNIPAYYWKVIRTPVADIVYWMPTAGTKTKYSDLNSCIIGYGQFVVTLGFDPVSVF